MASHKTDAFVVKAVPFRESDKRVVLFSCDHGLVTAIAPAAMKSRRRFGGALEPLTLLSLLYTAKPNQSLWRLQEVEIIDPYLSLKKELKKMTYGSYFLELISEVAREGDSFDPLFHFLVSFLNALKESKDERRLGRYFEARLLEKIGWHPILDGCVSCKAPVDQMRSTLHFSYEKGGVVCVECGGMGGIKVSKSTVQVWNKMLRNTPSLVSELHTLLPNYLFHHLGKRPKAYEFMQQVLS